MPLSHETTGVTETSDVDATAVGRSVGEQFKRSRNISTGPRIDAWHLIVKDVYTTFKDEDPVDEEPDLVNLGKGILSIFVEMFEYVDFLILDQLDCLHYRIDDSELEIVAILNGELIVFEMRLIVCEVIIKNECTTGKNEEPDVEEPESSDNTLQSIDPDGEEPESTDFSDNLGCDQASSSSTADLTSPSFPLYVWPSETGDNAAQIIDESCMEAIIRVVNLTIRRVQPVEKVLKYFQFILFDLNMREQMYRRMYCHSHDQLVWWYHRKGDSELEIVGKLYGGFIVQGMRLILPDDWKPSARMVLNHLENYDLQYLNFARSAFTQLNKDIPQECLHLIKEIMDMPRINTIRKRMPTGLPSFAYSYKYL
ncbi:Hypothetical protein CINCED_3A012276 [Cinara cedri]|uniref:Uncharacterized protein n=1 Tax=Cinara cedri TaxID=506608 RepID=A0A5E4MJX6_9HEMI|nr:Hypothetical protein CINCED_3A012276 [Cinara cedri]